MKTLIKLFFFIFSLFITSSLIAQNTPHGTWDTNFGKVYLYYYDAGDGYVLEGEYAYTDPNGENYGFMMGDFDGTTFSFDWEETSESGMTRTGQGYFVFNSNYTFYEGAWEQDGTGTSGTWNGTKISGDACFLENSVVTLADFSQKNIEDLKLGDELLSFDRKNQEFINTSLEKIEVFESNTFYQIDFIPEIFEASLNTKPTAFSLKLTAKHPIKTNKGFKLVEDLKVGDKLILDNGNFALVQNLEQFEEPEKQKVYNLKTSGKPYFVNGILVLEK